MEAITQYQYSSNKKPWPWAQLVEILLQWSAINQDLQQLGLTLISLNNDIKNTWLEQETTKNKIDDDTYRCFLRLFDMIQKYDINGLRNSYWQYRSLYLESESKPFHFNKIRKQQIVFLQETFTYLYEDMLTLKKKILNDDLIDLRRNAFSRPSIVTTAQHDQMHIFLREFPSRLNTIEAFLQKIDQIWSKETKEKMQTYGRIKK